MARAIVTSDGLLIWECPAPSCGNHAVPIEGEKKWNWNGSVDLPTLMPSVKVEWTWGEEEIQKRCHFFLTEGKVAFCPDSTHSLAGQTVELAEWRD